MTPTEVVSSKTEGSSKSSENDVVEILGIDTFYKIAIPNNHKKSLVEE